MSVWVMKPSWRGVNWLKCLRVIATKPHLLRFLCEYILNNYWSCCYNFTQNGDYRNSKTFFSKNNLLLSCSVSKIFSHSVHRYYSAFGCLVLLHGKPCLALKQTWCYFDFIFETGLMWYLPGSTLFVKQFCGEKVKMVPTESFHHQPCWTVHRFDLLGDGRACTVPALSLGLSPGSSIIYWVPGCPQVPGSVIGIFRRWYQRMGPILLCSSFLSYCFFLFFYLDQYAEFCP